MSFLKYFIAILLMAPLVCDEISTESRGLVVHEWGTFTSIAAEDGSAIDWDALSCKDDLPKFVNSFGYRGFKWSLRGTVRMETPVLYFYSAHELAAHVKVTFPKGLITEWYPAADYAVDQKISKDGPMKRLEANLNGIDTSLRSLAGIIEWKNVSIQPDSSPVFPTEPGASRYYAARETDAAPLTAGGQHEKFLFYRGVGQFPVPLAAQMTDDGKVAVKNVGSDPVPVVLLFENYGDGIRYRNAGAVEKDLTIDPPAPNPLATLRGELETALIEQGLFPKEAQAMVETWRTSWFEEGSRLIYIVPSKAVDKNLPLQIDPAPSATARVFVGRIELITPETKRLVEEAIAHNDWHTMDTYGRFLGTILRRIYTGNSFQQEQVLQFLRDAQTSAGAGYCH